MIELTVIKCHGSGNDFLLIDELSQAVITEQHRAGLSRDLCNRHLGFGADGVLFLLPADDADCTMRMFNPDGSEAQMCGNGLRCAARYYADLHRCDEVLVQTKKTQLLCQRDRQDQGVDFFRTQIGPVSFDPRSVPLAQKKPLQNQIIPELDPSIRWYGLSITNPHLVALVTAEQQSGIEALGEAANTLPLFPEGVNCSLIRLVGDNGLFVTTFERGAGLTNACGTAMAASGFISVYTGVRASGDCLEVGNRGGRVFVESTDQEGSKVWLSGNATFVFTSTCVYNPQTGRLGDEAGAYQQLL